MTDQLDTAAIRAQMEAMAGLTAGPSFYYADLPSVEPNWHIVTTENKMRVLANVHIEPGNAMDVANASLIAAAPDMRETILSLCDALDELRADNERLRAALQPFAEADEYYGSSSDDNYAPRWAEFFTIGDFRRARAALGEITNA